MALYQGYERCEFYGDNFNPNECYKCDETICPNRYRPIESSEKNPYWGRITAIANRQREKGISEYGKGIECDNADIMTRLDRIEEELIDALMYLEHLRDGIRGSRRD